MLLKDTNIVLRLHPWSQNRSNAMEKDNVVNFTVNSAKHVSQSRKGKAQYLKN